MYELCACCGGATHILARDNSLDDFSSEITRIADALYQGKNIVSDAAFLRAQAGQILKAVFAGYGKDFTTVDFASPDFNMLANLTNNCYHFSAAKNYQEIKDMSLALRDGDRVRSWQEYQKAVTDINIKYNVDFLRTEYSTAISSAQMAGRWTQFESEKADFPMLKYQTIGDRNVRESHAALNGVKKKVDDGFWNSHYPPNGWNCRCEAVQVTGTSKETPNDKITYPTMSKMFKTNLAKDGVVFPMGHPYYVDIPSEILDKDVKAEVNQYYQQSGKKWIDENIEKGEKHINLTNLKTGKIVISKASLTEVINHSVGSNKLLVKTLMDNLTELELVRGDVKLKEGSKKKELRGVLNYNYYSLTVGKKEFIVNMEQYKGYEKLYAVRSRENKKS